MQLSGAVIFASLAATLVTAAKAKPTVYLIRHGEKPPNDGLGLSPEGGQRAQCLRTVFGAASGYNIGYILAQTPKDNVYADKPPPLDVDGKRTRPYLTVKPVADDLGLTVDTSCDRDDEKCVKDAVKDYDGDGNILICWEHHQLNNLAGELGAEDVKNYPDDSYDLIWTQPHDYDVITAVTSESCPGLDV
ncbi:hypothetical protein E0Z10_g690 [Xylaria hypoxylon]|uniref:Phosphoglycerate mutase family protein n=1 Tax=Xylaria hypoxylon TaxID=37992 RepID=A0A4Z0Z8I5_9PEZI|nr:hypothetical protein E0Z10_g690 [Xylaria hypoxylon]